MKYIVMECHYSYAVLLDEKGKFVKAANLGYKVGEVVEDPVLIREPSARLRVFRIIFRSIVLLLLLVLLVLGIKECAHSGQSDGSGCTSQDPDVSRLISDELAYSTALEHAELTEDQVTEHSCELESEGGKYVYDVEFSTSTHSYEYEIDAEDGRILSFDKELIN